MPVSSSTSAWISLGSLTTGAQMTRSTSRLTSHCSSWRVALETISMLMSGYRSLIVEAIRASSIRAGIGPTPIRTRPRCPEATRRMSCTRREASTEITSERRAMNSARSVGRDWPRLRSNRREPSWSSRCDIRLLSVGWVTPRTSAALRRLPDSQITLTSRRSRTFMTCPRRIRSTLIRKRITTCESLLFHHLQTAPTVNDA